jgi:beta-1,4-mannosyltransferase
VNVYVYPWSSKAAPGRRNPYVRNFIASLEPYCRVVNCARPTAWGLFGVVPWLPTLDVLVLHWPANIPDKRGAMAQSAFLRALLLAKSLLGFRVVYVLHDRVSHSTTRWRWKRRLMRAVLRHADLVVTHARDGVAFAREHGHGRGDTIRYLPHPFESPASFIAGAEPFEHRRYDVLVWGTVVAYKGVGEAVRFLGRHGLDRRYRILVAGRFQDAAEFDALSREAPGISIENRFVPDEELEALMAQTKVILFPYRRDSVLGSSLLSDAVVIGPDAGAFRDCAALGLISTFGELSELPGVIERGLAADRSAAVMKRKAFAAEHTWAEFGRTLVGMLGRKDRPHAV